MTKAELEAVVCELKSRVEYLEGALDSIAEDGETLGLWAEARRQRKATAPKTSDARPLTRETVQRIAATTKWLEDRAAVFAKSGAMRAAEVDRLKFPLTLEAALRRWLPKLEHADRMRVYRQYLRESLPLKGGIPKPYKESFNQHAHQEPTMFAPDETVQQFLATERKGECFTAENWEYFANRFDVWHHGFKERTRKSKAKKAAAAKWSKK